MYSSNGNQVSKDQESSQARRCRAFLESLGCTYMQGHRAHFFSIPYDKVPLGDVTEVHYVDSLYAALCAPEPVVALRAYVQASEYSVGRSYAPLRYKWESAHYDARNRVERLMKGEG